jgi:hypothetical protein
MQPLPVFDYLFCSNQFEVVNQFKYFLKENNGKYVHDALMYHTNAIRIT